MGTTHSKLQPSHRSDSHSHSHSHSQFRVRVGPQYPYTPPRSFSTELSQNPFYVFQLFSFTNSSVLTSSSILKNNVKEVVTAVLVQKLIRYFVLCSIFEDLQKYRGCESGINIFGGLWRWMGLTGDEEKKSKLEFLRSLDRIIFKYSGILQSRQSRQSRQPGQPSSDFNSKSPSGIPNFYAELKNRIQRILESQEEEQEQERQQPKNKWNKVESYLVDVMVTLQKECTRVPCFSDMVSLLQRYSIGGNLKYYEETRHEEEKNQNGKRRRRGDEEKEGGGGGTGNSVTRILEVLGDVLGSLQAEEENEGIEKLEFKHQVIAAADKQSFRRGEEIDTYPVRKRRKLGGTKQDFQESVENLSGIETRLDQVSEEYHRLETDYNKLLNLHDATCKELEVLKKLVLTRTEPRTGLRKSQSRSVSEESNDYDNADGDRVDDSMDVSLSQVADAMDSLDQDISCVVREFLSQNSSTENLSSHIHTLILQRHLLSPASTKDVITEDTKIRYLTHLIWKQLHNFIFQCTPFSHLHKEMNKVYKYFGICDILTDFKSATLSTRTTSPASTIYDSFLSERIRIEKKVIMYIAKIIHVTCHSYPSSPSSSLLPLSPLTPVPFDTTIWTNLITVTTDAIVQSLSVYSGYGYNETGVLLNSKSDSELRMDEEDLLNLKREVRVVVQDALKLFMLTKCVGLGDRVHEEDGVQCEVVFPDENSKLVPAQEEWFNTQTPTFRDDGMEKTFEKDNIVDGGLGQESSECRRTRIHLEKREIGATVVMVLLPAIVISSRDGDMSSLVRPGEVVIS